ADTDTDGDTDTDTDGDTDSDTDSDSDTDTDGDTDTRAVVVGHGNVGLDVCRVLMRTNEGRARTDIAEPAARALSASRIQRTHFCGRRGALDAKFTNVELRELGALTRARPLVDAADLDVAEPDSSDRDGRLKRKNLETLRSFVDLPGDKPGEIRIRFNLQPVEILGGERVEALRFEHTRVEGGKSIGLGTFEEIPCGLVVLAVGYRSQAITGLPFDDEAGIIPNDGGRVDEGVYVSGWIRRGPRGVISTNRQDGGEVAKRLLAEVEPKGAAGREGLEALMADRHIGAVNYADWKQIDAHEVQSATDGAPRRKLVTREALMDVLAKAR
ncbi:MAG: hypothetical protein ACPGNT_02430, partial [Rhodospirillales bacterium]